MTKNKNNWLMKIIDKSGRCCFDGTPVMNRYEIHSAILDHLIKSAEGKKEKMLCDIDDCGCRSHNAVLQELISEWEEQKKRG